jgi:hypothetical protein
METKKMSLANIQGKMTRDEMKKIMGGLQAGVCTGVLDCPASMEGLKCGELAPECTCRALSDGGYGCRP